MINFETGLPSPVYEDDDHKLRISGTRVLLEMVIRAFQQGEQPEGIVDMFPNLSLASVYAVIAWYFQHRTDVDIYVNQVNKNEDLQRERIRQHYTSADQDLLERLRLTRAERFTTA